MRWPIRLQILAPFVLLLVVVLVSVTVLDARLAAERSERQIVEQLGSIVRTLHESSFPLSDAVLRQMRGLSGAEFVVTGRTGDLLAASSDLRLPVLQTGVPRQAVQDFEFSAAPVQADSRQYLHAATNIGARRGPEESTLHILYPQDSWDRIRHEAIYPHLLVGAAAVLFAGLLSLAIAGRISHPIKLVRAQAAGLLGVSSQALAVPRRNDELRDLVLAFNALKAELDDLRSAIRRGERLAILGRLSGGLAHTLRNHCTGATMALQLHQRRCRDDDESIAVALRQLSATTVYLERFLTAGRPQQTTLAWCDPVQLVAEVLESVCPTARHRKVSYGLHHELPPGFALLADQQQLRQLLLNCVLNALEAAGPGGWLRIELEAAPAELVVRVLDGGGGPPAEVVDRLFEPFVTGKPEGIGLGLSTARQIAEAHGGTLEYRPRDGATCFELRLPQSAAVGSHPRDGMRQRLTACESPLALPS